jgi:hypothetical protein
MHYFSRPLMELGSECRATLVDAVELRNKVCKIARGMADLRAGQGWDCLSQFYARTLD